MKLAPTLLVAAFLAVPGATAAQSLYLSQPDRHTGAHVPNEVVLDDRGRRLGGAIAGAAAGTVVGGFLGYRIDRARGVPSENPGLFGMLGGALLGSTVGSALGAHAGADGEGSLGRRLLVTTGIAVMGSGLVAASEGEFQLAFVISIPLAQVLAAGF